MPHIPCNIGTCRSPSLQINIAQDQMRQLVQMLGEHVFVNPVAKMFKTILEREHPQHGVPVLHPQEVTRLVARAAARAPDPTRRDPNNSARMAAVTLYGPAEINNIPQPSVPDIRSLLPSHEQTTNSPQPPPPDQQAVQLSTHSPHAPPRHQQATTAPSHKPIPARRAGGRRVPAWQDGFVSAGLLQVLYLYQHLPMQLYTLDQRHTCFDVLLRCATAVSYIGLDTLTQLQEMTLRCALHRTVSAMLRFQQFEVKSL